MRLSGLRSRNNMIVMSIRALFEIFEGARRAYCYTQTILYGAQDFQLEGLFKEIERCKSRGMFVAVSIDGTKKSGDLFCSLELPDGLFERELEVHCGRSMLKRFQMEGQTLESE